MTVSTIAPVTKTVTVRATPERAFEVFTARFGDWWPTSHHTGDEAIDVVLIEPFVGGRWFERGVRGTEQQWGEVLAWEPPVRLLLSWQLDADFKPGLPLAAASEVEVTFVDAGDGTTTVTLEHRKLEAFGDRAIELQTSLGGGWSEIVDAYAVLANP